MFPHLIQREVENQERVKRTSGYNFNSYQIENFHLVKLRLMSEFQKEDLEHEVEVKLGLKILDSINRAEKMFKELNLPMVRIFWVYSPWRYTLVIKSSFLAFMTSSIIIMSHDIYQSTALFKPRRLIYSMTHFDHR